MSYLKNERVFLKSHSEYTEKWVQDRIAEDPAILGLGELVLLQRERAQPRAGRLDLLMSDGIKRRYEIELQLGSVDESHIIRTIEYWDIERRRYPHYDHCAVLIAEDITSRFLNVIALFNGIIPFIALQIRALTVGENLTLVFTKVLDEMTLGVVDEDEEAEAAPTDRMYWVNVKGTNKTVAMADEMLELVQTFDSTLELKYNKFYIGLTRGGRPFNFVTFTPQKKHMMVMLRINQSEEINEKIDNANLDMLEHTGQSYRIRLRAGAVGEKKEVLKELMKNAFDHRNA